ncbi:hypothetical protein PC129_g16798 [Phytophthora cactorum]|uniref:Uncharacterized protein n=1 Tax=Phytophthora cactorum TaxID=29920 RepID=A0A8T1HIA1_9STRA|nr:hypothetical protein Pcac1_g831 [Phytophthora cactorum]KAG2875043.1 hypothetical protein PC114_g24939 [Phytophthora cactorum]KAG2917345.1 hypothetical protein PC117_g17474 [Phytophthora cactorum]KAG2966863.1 hypothetical protein PC120_g27033 [Phytophthora cactorum]KAG2967750.1 hypothetical protein PC119_g24393 [Phytophthora cactorum]
MHPVGEGVIDSWMRQGSSASALELGICRPQECLLPFQDVTYCALRRWLGQSELTLRLQRQLTLGEVGVGCAALHSQIFFFCWNVRFPTCFGW